MRPEILARYAARQVPRYTSYPTAPHFSAAVGETDYRSWFAALPADEPVSLYLHLPFCRKMCWYCGCHTSVTARQAPIDSYGEMLRREVALVAEALPARLTAAHVHFGGGTPTLMAPEGFAGIMALLRERFDLAADAEVAIEIDPRTLSDDMVRALADAGVTRASIGVQSFDPEVQHAINRAQSFEETASAVERLRVAGIAAINFDLLYGLPKQTLESCLESTARAAALGPDRLSVFGYAHVPAFKRHQRKIDEALLPDATERFAQAEGIAEALAIAGYRRIGLDHFAWPSDDLARAADEGRLHRNFQGYTTDACRTLLGFGASAIGRLGNGYVQNTVLTSDYRRWIDAGRLATARGCPVGAEDRLRGAVIERLMCDFRVDLAALGAEALLEKAVLQPLLADGLAERRGSVIEVRPDARSLVRTVAAAFDAYLGAAPARHAPAV